jgi:hypothetical protein
LPDVKLNFGKLSANASTTAAPDVDDEATDEGRCDAATDAIAERTIRVKSWLMACKSDSTLVLCLLQLLAV